MGARASIFVGLALVVAAFGAATCERPVGAVCEPGAAEGCTCGGGVLGTRECDADGEGWGSCDCSSADGDGDGDHDGDVDPDAYGDSGPVGGGPLTYAVERATVVVERVFDVDGDGALDNAVADLGADHAAVFALMLGALFDSATSRGDRQIAHFPWVEDLGSLTDASVTLINASARDLDEPEDREDDFSGEEPFYMLSGVLDACGEPRYYMESASLVGGVLVGSGGTFAISLGDVGLVIRSVVTRGTLSADGDAELALVGGALLIGDLGGAYDLDVSEDQSLLEILLTGGAAFGVAALPGLQPDLDLDGDGVERIEVDGDGHIVRCIDGDRTIVEGRECWQDPRFADAVSLTLRLDLARAVFVGREPGWEALVTGECTDPPASSILDPH